ncbi:hypothetical protein [Campylobacter showae]|uniref:hypothetical protein n=1 Tax=Campylobacter showae TaxID=204 RepID=UPI000F07F03A|nr:hypothetical protein [Campylobacter showae]
MYENSTVVVQSKSIDKADFDLFLNSIFALRENDLNITELTKDYGVSRINIYSWLEPEKPDVDSPMAIFCYEIFCLDMMKTSRRNYIKFYPILMLLKKPDSEINDKMLSSILKVPIGYLERMSNDNSGWQKRFYNIVKRQHPKVLYYQFYYIRQFILKNTQHAPLGSEYGDIEQK